MILTGFGERRNLVRDGRMFVIDEAKNLRKVGGVDCRVKSCVFCKLVFESDEQEFSLRGVNSKKISSHPGRDVLKSVLKARNT